MTTVGKSANEGIKDASQYLRGTILDGLANSATGSLSKDDQQLTYPLTRILYPLNV